MFETAKIYIFAYRALLFSTLKVLNLYTALICIKMSHLIDNDRDLTILGRQRDDDGQNKLLQINGSKDNSSYIINRMNLIQF